VAQRVGRGIALLSHDRGTRRGRVVSSTPRPQFSPGKDPVPIAQEAGWAPGPVWKGGKFRRHRDSIPDRPVRSSVAIPTELPAHMIHQCMIKSVVKWLHIWVVSLLMCVCHTVRGWVINCDSSKMHDER